jgi:hypothetical protein
MQGPAAEAVDRTRGKPTHYGHFRAAVNVREPAPAARDDRLNRPSGAN